MNVCHEHVFEYRAEYGAVGAGASSKTKAEELLTEMARSREDIGRYRKAVDELRRVLASLDSEVASAHPEVLQAEACGEEGQGAARRAERGHGAKRRPAATLDAPVAATSAHHGVRQPLAGWPECPGLR